MTGASGDTATRLDRAAIANWRPLGAGVYAAGQPTASEWAALGRAGLKSVINLRPSAEQPDGSEGDDVRAQGMAYACLPVADGADLGRRTVLKFDDLMREATRPVLVHCASANRVGALFALRAAWLEAVDSEAAVALGRAAGLGSLEARVRELLDSEPG